MQARSGLFNIHEPSSTSTAIGDVQNYYLIKAGLHYQFFEKLSFELIFECTQSSNMFDSLNVPSSDAMDDLLHAKCLTRETLAKRP